MYCKKCGKEIEDNVVFCPLCGTQQREDPKSRAKAASEKKEINIFCLVGLIISGLSLFLNFWGLTGTAGVVLSSVGYFDCSKKGEQGKVLAIVGIILGCFSIVYALFFMIFIGSWFSWLQ